MSCAHQQMDENNPHFSFSLRSLRLRGLFTLEKSYGCLIKMARRHEIHRHR